MDEEGNLGYYLYDETTGEEKMFSVVEEQREFSTESKILGVFAPGAYQAKEAAKYAYDEDEYKKRRSKYALKGAFTPGTATYIKKKVERMAREGASKEEIRDYLENKGHGNHIMAGIGEIAANALTTGATGKIADTGAIVVGIADKVSKNRAKFNKE